MENNKYFLYMHVRLDKNTPFYIGIGTIVSKKNGKIGRYFRAYSKQKRNNIWCGITNKTDYRVDIVEESNDRNYIFQREIDMIKYYGRIVENNGTLANITKGGDGACGFKRSQIDRDNKSLAKISQKERDIIKYLYISGVSTKNISIDRNHCKKTIKKILECCNLLHNRFTIRRGDGLRFKTEKEACEFMKCTRGYISMAIHKNKKCLNYTWTKINEFDLDDQEIERLRKLGYEIEIG